MPSLKQSVFGFVRKYGRAARVVASSVLNVVAPGSGAVVELFGKAIDSTGLKETVDGAFKQAEEMAHDQWEQELLDLTHRNRDDLQKLNDVLDALQGDLATLCDKAFEAERKGENAEASLRQLLQNDRDLQELVKRVGSRLEEKIEATYDEVRQCRERVEKMDAKIDKILEERNVRVTTTGPLAVPVTDGREAEYLRQARLEYRKMPAGVVSEQQWTNLGDGLAAAGAFGDASECHQRAAEAASSPDNKADAYFKAYRDACELRKWDEALSALHKAVALRPQQFRPFDMKRYEVLSILGAGGFGTVFHVRDRYGKDAEGNPLIYAIKTLHLADSDTDLDKIFGEAHTLNSLNDPAIIRIVDQNFADTEFQQRPYFKMEYFPGPSLEAYLRDHGKLSLDDLLAIAVPVAKAVHSAHEKKILHRDLKPGNILVLKLATGWKVKVIDFGLAVRMKVAVQASNVMAQAHPSERDKSFTGTFDFAAPEQKGKFPGVNVGPYSDVYAFGKTCLMVLFGTTEVRSWHWQRLPENRRNLAQELLERCASEELTDRWQSFAEVLERLQKLSVDPEEAALKAKNLKRWQASSNPRKWIEPRLNGWNHEQWHRLLEQVKASAFWPMDEAELRRSLEETRLEMLAELDHQRKEKEQGDRKRLEIEREKQRNENECQKKEEQQRQAEAERIRKEADEEQRRKRLPELLVAPFNERKAKEAQTAWATYLGRKVVEEFDLGKGVKLSMALIPLGTFMMGSPERELERFADEKLHEVTLTKPFFMGTFPVTVEQFKAFVNAKGFKTAAERGDGAYAWTGRDWETDPKFNWRYPGFTQDDNHPVTCVSWYDATAFAIWRSEMSRCRIMLPTESQWEYSCRAGTTTPYFFGETISASEVNYNRDHTCGLGEKKTTPIGTFRSNHWGLQDMHGNVWEWCLDWYAAKTHKNGKCLDPLRPDEGSQRVYRGGSWYDYHWDCRSAYRYGFAPSSRYSILGIRVLSSLSGD